MEHRLQGPRPGGSVSTSNEGRSAHLPVIHTLASEPDQCPTKETDYCGAELPRHRILLRLSFANTIHCYDGSLSEPIAREVTVGAIQAQASYTLWRPHFFCHKDNFFGNIWQQLAEFGFYYLNSFMAPAVISVTRFSGRVGVSKALLLSCRV